MANKDDNKNRIYEVREYRTPDGRHIVAQTPLDGSAIIYVGHSVGQVKNAAGQVGQIPYSFIIEADTIEEAFGEKGQAANQKAWNETIEQVKQQHAKQQKRIVVAGAMDDAARQMIAPGGNGKTLRIVK